MVKYQKERDVKSGRAEGDKIIYYLLHSLFASLFFIVMAIYLNFFTLKSDLVTDLFTWNFFLAVVYVFIASVGSNVIGRMFAYYMLQGIYKKSATKNFIELNSTGLNKIGLRYLIATSITSFIFCIGAVAIIQKNIFGTKEEAISLIIIYLSLKIFTFILTKLLIESRG